MLRVFTDLNHYNSDNRVYLADILRPFLPSNRFIEFGIDEDLIKLVDHIEDSDICLLPMAWNYYLNTNQINKAKELIKKAQTGSKKILVSVMGDYFISLPNFDHIIGMYCSTYLSKSTDKTFPLPVIIQDPFSFLEIGAINLREFNEEPSVGFCGQSDPSIIISSIKMAKLAWQNIKFNLHLSQYYPGPIIPPTYLRKKLLDIMDKTDKVDTEFIRRDRYQAGESKKGNSFQQVRKEFYKNIENTDYTLCIRGTGNFSARIYETLALGRIPIFINTDCMLPFNDVIDWKKHVIWIEQREISEIATKIRNFHNGLTQDSFISLQIKNRKLWEEYFSFPGFIKNLTSHLIKRID